METRIEILPAKKLIGYKVRMSLANNKTALAWSIFMPRRNEVRQRLNSNLFSLQVYDPSYFENVNPANEFDKWAAVEVSRYENIPEGMDSFDVAGGLYAIFDYKGLSTDTAIYHYFFTTWLPASRFKLNDRPHFEILSDNDKNGVPESGEEIWIPIQHRLLFGI